MLNVSGLWQGIVPLTDKLIVLRVLVQMMSNVVHDQKSSLGLSCHIGQSELSDL